MIRLMDRIGKTVKGRINEAKLTFEEDEIRKKLKISSVNIVNQTIEKLQKADILSIKGSKIISAYPFSAIPTLHKVIFEDGHRVYALCATDALGIHFMLNENIAVISNPQVIIEFVSNRWRDGEKKIRNMQPARFIRLMKLWSTAELHLEIS